MPESSEVKSIDREPRRGRLDDVLDVIPWCYHHGSTLIKHCGPIFLVLGLWQFASVVQAQEDVREDVMKLMNTTHTSKN